MRTDRSNNSLASLRTRLIVFLLLTGLAVASIWLIDRRAMTRMREYRMQHRAAPTPDRRESASGASEGSGFRLVTTDPTGTEVIRATAL